MSERTGWWRALKGALWMGVAFVLLACGGNVAIDDGSGAASGPGGASGQGGASTIGSGEAGGGGAVVALVTSHPDPNIPCLQPGALFVVVASQAISCAQMLPGPITRACVSPSTPFVWELCVTLPSSSALAVGTIDLESGAYNSQVATEGGCPGSCCNTWGGSVKGTLQILTVDASSVSFTLAGTGEQTSSFGTVAADGTYNAVRCP
jgi:hypothetical protein